MPRSEDTQRFYRYFGPLLDALRDLGGSGTPDEVAEKIAENNNLSDELQNELIASGQSRFRNQVAWARFYLVREGLVDSSKRGVWNLTQRGQSTHLTLEQSRELTRKWVRISREQRRAKQGPTLLAPETVNDNRKSQRPAEIGEVNDSAAEIAASDDHRSALLRLLLSLPPAGFERLSQRLLRESRFTQVVVTGRSGDGGIDGYGTLQINPLVSFKVLFQCKRYAGAITPSQVRDFRGAMAGRADKGIVITTGTYTAEARREASRDGVPAIELIDGEKLIAMLEELELGLKPIRAYEIDEAFFNEFKG